MSVLGAILDAARRLLSSKETSACLQQEDSPIWEHPFLKFWPLQIFANRVGLKCVVS